MVLFSKKKIKTSLEKKLTKNDSSVQLFNKKNAFFSALSPTVLVSVGADGFQSQNDGRNLAPEGSFAKLRERERRQEGHTLWHGDASYA